MKEPAGHKAFRREVLSDIILEWKRFGIEPELTAKIASRGWRIYEVPISYVRRSYEEGKKVGWKDGIAAILHILHYGGAEKYRLLGTGLRSKDSRFFSVLASLARAATHAAVVPSCHANGDRDLELIGRTGADAASQRSERPGAA